VQKSGISPLIFMEGLENAGEIAAKSEIGQKFPGKAEKSGRILRKVQVLFGKNDRRLPR
jgi:hypothetical protein